MMLSQVLVWSALTTIVFQLLGLAAVVSAAIFNDSLIRSSPS